ncbi:MAG: 4Fe-4S binding protein [Chloroflexota bacterium]
MQRRHKYERAWFTPGEVLGKPVADWRYNHPVTNQEKCSNCGWCTIYCPTGCIKEENGRVVRVLTYCKGCGICAKECAVGAIKMVAEESW